MYVCLEITHHSTKWKRASGREREREKEDGEQQ